MLFERKRVVQVMSRQGRSKRRMPRFPRRGGRSVLVVALHARARLLGRRRRCRVRYSRERSRYTRGFRRYRRRSRWSRRRRGGGGFLRGGRTAAKHGLVVLGVLGGPWYGVRGGGAAPAFGPVCREVVAKLLRPCAALQGQWCGQRGQKDLVFEIASVFQPLASHNAALRFSSQSARSWGRYGKGRPVTIHSKASCRKQQRGRPHD